MFDANHFHIEATFDTTDSDKVAKKFFIIFTKDDINSPFGSHIITGVP